IIRRIVLEQECRNLKSRNVVFFLLFVNLSNSGDKLPSLIRQVRAIEAQGQGLEHIVVISTNHVHRFEQASRTTFKPWFLNLLKQRLEQGNSSIMLRVFLQGLLKLVKS